MYLLDTNVVSELRRRKPHGAVVAWFREVPEEALFISAVTIGEIQRGIDSTAEQDAEKARTLADWLDQLIGTFHILPMDAIAFRVWAQLNHRKSTAVSEDAMIAATAIVNRLSVVTRNVRDFEAFDVEIVNPFV